MSNSIDLNHVKHCDVVASKNNSYQTYLLLEHVLGVLKKMRET